MWVKPTSSSTSIFSNLLWIGKEQSSLECEPETVNFSKCMVGSERGNQEGNYLYELVVENHLLLNQLKSDGEDFVNIKRMMGIGLSCKEWD